jgi:hypothetical protein
MPIALADYQVLTFACCASFVFLYFSQMSAVKQSVSNAEL